MTLPRVAVLLATYNGAAHCEAQLISILWQRDIDVHVYVRDDGSRDATLDVIWDWISRHPERITLIDNGGVSTGSANGNFFTLLRAIDCAQYDYVAFADQDDVWTPDKLTRAITQLAAAGGEGYSSDLIAYQTGGNAAWVLHKAGRPASLDYLFQGGSAGCTYVLSGHAARIVTQVIATAPAFPQDPSHDWIIYAICRSRGLKWVHDPGAEILYRQHASNQYGANRGLGELTLKLKAIRSKWYHEHILWLRHVVVGNAEECRVFDAVARGGIFNRWWLICHARRFRRTRGYVARLRIAIALRLI